MDMITSWKREGIEEGLQQGRAETRETALKYIKLILRSKHGTDADCLEPKIRRCSIEQLDVFASKALESLEELDKWLDSELGG